MAEKLFCPIYKKCGSCKHLSVPYQDQLKEKQRKEEELLGEFGPVSPILGMKNPLYYRNKVHHVFGYQKGNVISGTYEYGSHVLLPVAKCYLEDEKSQEIIKTIEKLCKSFKIRTYNEDTGFGWLRHVMIRRGFSSGEIMVVLVAVDPVFPGKKNFAAALKKAHPDITTVVLNINDKDTSMVLGKRDIPIYGPGFIKDRLMGLTFRISPQSFYQINPVETEVLYEKAIEFAELTGGETVIDAYSGIGTIGLCAAKYAKRVIGVELNPDAVKDAKQNARENKIENAEFYVGDAGDFMVSMAENKETADVVFMDPPRTGSTEVFMDSVVKMGPKRVVYVSCGPDTLARDLAYLTRKGYAVKKIQPVDMFPFTEHCEMVVQMSRA